MRAWFVIKNKLKWIKKTFLTKDMIVYVLIAEALFWSPCIVAAVLAITINRWWWTAFGSICAFWAGPFTPAVPLQLGLAIFIKTIYLKIKRRKNDNSKRKGFKRS